MKPITAPVAAEVRQDVKSEAALVETTKQAISTCDWKVGECAAAWKEQFAEGRTDADFGALVDLSGDQVYQRRRVWERFHGQTDIYRNLCWSHFYAALNWDDATLCLEWASEHYATVAEMKRWRSVQHGETDTVSVEFTMGSSGNSETDPFGEDVDPFGEGEGAGGTDSGTETGGADGEEDGTETGGTEAQEQPTRPAGSATEASGGPSKKHDALTIQRLKTVKTAEALMREVDELNLLCRFKQHDAMIDGIAKILNVVKSVKKG